METKTKTVKNTSSLDLLVVGVGMCKAGATIKVADDFHNANFETVEEKKTETKNITNNK